MDKHNSICPVIRDEEMRLFERFVVGDTFQFLPFTKRILWLRESETKIVLRHDENVLSNRSTLNDFYGYLTSLEEAVKDAKRLANEFAIGVGDRLSVDLFLQISEIPVMEDASKNDFAGAKNAYGKQWLSVPSYGNGQRWWYLSDQPDTENCLPRLESVIVLEALVYSTRRHQTGKMPKALTAWIEAERKSALAKNKIAPLPEET
jgi:hypothetical protein